MSRFRRLGLAATAAAAVLALAVPTGASAIKINGSSSPWYTVSGSSFGWTFFALSPVSTGGSTGVQCFNGDNGMPINYHQGWGHGWGLADGQARTLFVPAFQQPHPTGGFGCWFIDHNGNGSAVTLPVSGALALELTGLAPGQNPSSPRRKYDGRLFFYENFSLSFVLATYPGCSVKIVGPQSANLPGQIVVDDDTDQIDMDVSGASFAATKTAACPSTIGDVVRMYQTSNSGWRLNNVTVTP